mmetsp:Transcript_3506/g.6635  ORF Transcript_3506/g.6635 Transcript_3506/m.6635 type:complete len:337 (-) Transcript_3506:898-1908(-)
MGLLVKGEKLSSSRDSNNTSPQKVYATTGNVKKFNSTLIAPQRSRDFSTQGSRNEVIRPVTSQEVESGVYKQHEPLSIKQRIRAARKKGMRGDVHDMQYLVEEGPLSFRSFGFIGGFFMILSSILDFAENDEDSYARLVTFNLWLIGFISIQIEGRPFYMQIPFIYDLICLFFSFLKYVWGRGFLYFTAGCFQLFLFTKYNMICGSYFMLLGVFSIVFGYRASVRLAALRNSIHSKDEIKFMFHSFDMNRDGYLSPDEFREMLLAMGQGVDHNDFVAAMSAVDIDNKQMVSYADLEAWWEGYNDDDLPPGAGLCSSNRRSNLTNTHVNNPNAHLMT